MEYLLLRWLHIIGSTVLFGTGIGIAFFMLMAHRSGDARVIAHTAGIVVVADYVFTATAAVIQPITGALLLYLTGNAWAQPWVLLSLALYVFVGLLWLPVVGMQRRMHRLAKVALREQQALPDSYYSLFRRWFAFGVPAFLAMLAIFWLMVFRPSWA